MIKITGRDKEYTLENTNGKSVLNNEEIDLDIIENNKGSYHVIKDNKSHSIEIVNANFEKKEFEIRVNQQIYVLSAKDQFDELLEQLGMDSLSNGAAEDLLAPMPGLVLEILVKPGQEVEKGDSLLVLEAMKMENNIKCPADGVVKSIEIEKGQAVEKGQDLIIFE
ncbi:MAG: acetyl-CoA carboxylase biotin carboxyl carrier protein subunit [Salibacteraceae bacterium]